MNTNTTSILYERKEIITKMNCIDSFNDFMDLYKIGDTSKNIRHLFITDGNVASLDFMKEFTAKFDDDVCGNDCLFVLGSGEPYKTIESVMTIVDKALEMNFSTQDVFVAIGGGVICDITSFAASIYKRGIQVDLVPTTITAMIDSSIGGKTSCNRGNQRNIIGTYHPATNINFVMNFITSLPDIQIKSGLAEAFKTSIIQNKEVYEIFKNSSEAIISRDSETISKIIFDCVQTKSKIVEKDFQDENLRSSLNLGHTFAYALEMVVGMGVITHGEAVAWGISRAINLSLQKGYCNETIKNEIISILKTYGYETEPVPKVVKGGGVGERILEAMHKDKKNTSDKIRLVIPRNFEDIVIEEFEDDEILSVLK